MNSIFSVMCVLSILLATSDLTGSLRFRYRRQDDAAGTPAADPADGASGAPAAGPKCVKCGGSCGAPADMDCTTESLKDLKLDDASEDEKTLLTAIQEKLDAGFAVAQQTQCIIFINGVMSLRFCAPEKNGEEAFCDYVKTAANASAAECSLCPAAAEPCNKPAAGTTAMQEDTTMSEEVTNEETTAADNGDGQSTEGDKTGAAVKISLNYSTFCFIISTFLVHMIL